MTVRIVDAIHSLRPKSDFGFLDGKITEWGGSEKQPSEAEIDAEVTRLQAEYDAKQYQRDRQPEYPSMPDQLDMQYHDQINGTTTWKDAITKVKADNPKPE